MLIRRAPRAHTSRVATHPTLPLITARARRVRAASHTPTALQRAFSHPTMAAGSARRRGRAGAGGLDLLLEGVEADRADHDVRTDHVARRAVEAELVGELHAFLDRAAH